MLTSSFAFGAAEEREGADECAICLESLDGSLCTLPCKHSFHASCVKELRKIGVNHLCPMCRSDLPESP